MDAILNALFAMVGICRVVGWQNIYRSGYYHRVGKPGMYDRHPGDLYPTREAAEADVDPPAFYVATVKVVWYEDRQPHVNCVNSVPVPVSVSRRKLTEDGGEYRDGVWHASPAQPTEDEINRAIAEAAAFNIW